MEKYQTWTKTVDENQTDKRPSAESNGKVTRFKDAIQ